MSGHHAESKENNSPRVKTFVNNRGELVEEGRDIKGNLYRKVEKTIPGGLELTISTNPDGKGFMQKKTVITELEKNDHNIIEEFELKNGEWKILATTKKERKVQK